MNEQNKKNDIIVFFGLFLFTLIIFSAYLTGHFATDTFRIINIGYKNYAINYSFLDGRIFMGIIGLLANNAQIPIMSYVIILQILSIIVSCIVVMTLKNIILEYKKINNKIGYFLLILICYYTIFNFTYIENMYFVECLVMSFSLLFYILSAKYVVKRDIKNYIKAVVMLFLGLISYQGTISAFFVFVLLFSILKEKNIKVILKNLIVSGIIFIIGFLLNNICIIFIEKIFKIKQTRGFDIFSILPNIAFLLDNYWKILNNSSHLYPKYLYIIFAIIISLIVVSKMIKNKTKQKEQILIEQLAIIVFSIIVAFIPNIIDLARILGCKNKVFFRSDDWVTFYSFNSKNGHIGKKRVARQNTNYNIYNIWYGKFNYCNVCNKFK